MFSRGSLGRSALATRHPLAGGNYVVDLVASSSAAATATARVNGRLALAGSVQVAAAAGAGVVRRRSLATISVIGATVAPQLVRQRSFGSVSDVALTTAAHVLRRRQFGSAVDLALEASAAPAWHILNLGTARRRMVMSPLATRMTMPSRPRAMELPRIETRADHPEWRQMVMPARPRSMILPPQPGADMPIRKRSA